MAADRQPVQIMVNGLARSELAEPRRHLADFLREDLHLTGTHLGCEQGVCGACVVLRNGVPVRACLAYTVACADTEILTIEGLDEDAVMQTLRAAFTAEHGLQCGFCTPGMLVTARDIVLRHAGRPAIDDQVIRVALSGNLCRCTGYNGIVKAIRRALGEVSAWPEPELARFRTSTAQASSHNGLQSGEFDALSSIPLAQSPSDNSRVDTDGLSTGEREEAGNTAPGINSTFVLRHPLETVWKVIRHDIATVVACLPGADITSISKDGRIEGLFVVSMGPVAAKIAGEGQVTYDDSAFTGLVKGEGKDKRSDSRAHGALHFQLSETADAHTRMTATISFELTGMLAQFSRGGMVDAVVRSLIEQFRLNFEARLNGEVAPQAKSLSVFRLMIVACRHWLKRLFSRR
ncbi:2Fe-2S iron-sulfur cluster-binding protein [Allohahella marinimesophila]|uniref:2Fe-2S iron-sulfur cluster-binding protein n=1 Tax=Allohahella marinimesophila TaxID=1054972 RepID=A0ABP7NWC1_9GAMM